MQGFAGVPWREMSAQSMRRHLDAITAPIVLAMPAPTATLILANGEDAPVNFSTAGTVEVAGARIINFHITAISGLLLARPYRVIDGIKFIDDGEAPYFITAPEGRRIPAPTDCEIVGLEVSRFDSEIPSKYTLGVGMTP